MSSRILTFVACALAALAAGTDVHARVDDDGPGGDIIAMAEQTTGYPGNEEFGTALFSARAHYLFEFDEKVGAFVEGQVGEGWGVSIQMSPYTHWGVNALVWDTASDIELRQARIQAAFGDTHQVMAGKVALYELFGGDEGGRGAWESFLAPGLLTDMTVPYPAPGFSILYAVELSDLLKVRAAYADPDADWANCFHKESFYITEAEVKIPEGRVKAALWTEAQRNVYNGPGDWRPIGLSVDARRKFGDFDCFARMGFRPESLYQIDFSLAGGFTFRQDGWREGDQLGFGFVASSWSKEYLETGGAPSDPAAELQMELFYRMQLAPGFFVIADVQTFFCPGGIGGADPIGVMSVRAHVPF
jgi:hypothetical protein